MYDNVARLPRDRTAAAKPVSRLSDEASLVVGEVVALAGATWTVRADGPDLRCARARSCLLAPELGDRVLVASHGVQAHIIAVLDGARDQPTRLTAEGDLELAAPAGKISVTGAEGVSLTTPKDAVIAAGSAKVVATSILVSSRAIDFVGERLTAQLEEVKTVAASVESVATRWIQRVERAYRFVESEQVRATYIDWAAKAAINLKARNTLIRSREVTKVDGSQIHIG